MGNQRHVEKARHGFGRSGTIGGIFQKDSPERPVLGSWLNDITLIPKTRMVSGYVPDIREDEYPMAQILLIDSIRIRDCLPIILIQRPEEIINVSYRYLFKKHPAREMGFGTVFLEIFFDELGMFFRIIRKSSGQIEKIGVNLRIVPE